MLNENYLLEYIKTQLGFPFHKIELEDDKILDYVKHFTNREFSYYFPELRKTNLDLLSNCKVPGRVNEFYIIEPEGKEILNIKEIYFPASNFYAMGHPMFGAGLYSFGGVGFGKDIAIRNFAYEVDSSMTLKKFSRFDYTFQFTHPNIVRISPNPADNGQQEITIEYERMQSADFSGVPNDLQHMFLEFALADMMIVIGRIRKKYADGNLKTPFGEIPLGADIFEEGKEKKRELVEKFSAALIPNVKMNIG